MGVVPLIAIAVVLVSIGVIVREMRRPLTPFPRCRRCSYSLAGSDGMERCPECGTTLTKDTIVPAHSDDMGVYRLGWAVFMLALVLSLASAFAVERWWPWHVQGLKGSSEFTPTKSEWIASAGSGWNGATITRREITKATHRSKIRFDVRALRPAGSLLDGTLMFDLTTPKYRVWFEYDVSGKVIAADPRMGVPVGAVADVEAVRAAYRAAGLDPAVDGVLDAEANLLAGTIATSLDRPFALGNMFNTVTVVGAAEVSLQRTGGQNSSGMHVATFASGATRPPLWPLMLIAGFAVYGMTFRALRRRVERKAPAD
jgi:hypothetical protein